MDEGCSGQLKVQTTELGQTAAHLGDDKDFSMVLARDRAAKKYKTLRATRTSSAYIPISRLLLDLPFIEMAIEARDRKD